ncbi:class I SAM-dependent methyltransferase [Danxiaibacter flavus]|uniref:Class I SAM-dependent methyltransferase n=1 Tax=Danxiaibacter flavus TaxID=3049108 RepID=A0ABV3ZEH1_9BACT|nr:class I SAM-dependent methyltransferase [Chitinophagaceae bacterium DXS]
MSSLINKKHWENVYESKSPKEVSWTQKYPKTSMEFIQSLDLPKTAKIIDVGGGDSNLADCLLEEGYENITVLDISARALEKAKVRLGDKANKINWVVSDVTAYQPETGFDIWHDRAAFHFLTSKEQISKYVEIATKTIAGYLILGTFSTEGPKKCSGLDISQYNEETLNATFQSAFEKMKCITEDHVTPFNTRQNFLFCCFKKRN